MPKEPADYEQKTEHDEWIRLIGGGFAFQTAPFASHTNDLKRAKEYLTKARTAGLSVSDAVEHARAYLQDAPGWPIDEKVQLERVRKFFTGKLP